MCLIYVREGKESLLLKFNKNESFLGNKKNDKCFIHGPSSRIVSVRSVNSHHASAFVWQVHRTNNIYKEKHISKVSANYLRTMSLPRGGSIIRSGINLAILRIEWTLHVHIWMKNCIHSITSAIKLYPKWRKLIVRPSSSYSSRRSSTGFYVRPLQAHSARP